MSFSDHRGGAARVRELDQDRRLGAATHSLRFTGELHTDLTTPALMEVIELSSDEDDVTPPVPARTTGKSSADAFDLDAWEPDPAPAPAPRYRGAGASADPGGAASSGVAGASSDAPLDLDDDEALARALQAQYDAEVAASTCPLCKRPQHRNGLYKLGECGHRFCHRCVRDHVQKGLAEGLAGERRRRGHVPRRHAGPDAGHAGADAGSVAGADLRADDAPALARADDAGAVAVADAPADLLSNDS